MKRLALAMSMLCACVAQGSDKTPGMGSGSGSGSGGGSGSGSGSGGSVQPLPKTTLAFITNRGETFDMHVALLDVATHQITDLGGPHDTLTGVAISHDRKRLAITSPRAVYISNVDGSDRHQISASIPVDSPALDTPVWSPDDSAIVLGFGEFSNGGGGGSTIGTVPVSGGVVAPVQATLDGKCQLTDGPAFAPDASFAIAVRNNCLSTTDDGLWSYNPDGTGGQQVVHADLAISTPAILDANTVLAAGSLTGGSNGIVVIRRGQAPQVIAPPANASINDIAVSADQSIVVVTLTDQTTLVSNLFVTTDFATYTQLTQATGASPAF